MAALLFDLDGVLVDSLKAYREAWTAWAVAYRVTREEFPTDLHGLRPKDVIVRLRPDSPAAVEDFDAIFDKLVGTDVLAMPGSAELASALDGRPWAIVSSSQRRHVVAALRGAGIPDPPVLICGDDVAAGKPDPSCFLLAASRLGVPAADCLVVEDAPSGLAAARAAGMASVAVATTHDAGSLTSADQVFPTLTEAAPYLLARSSGTS
ncbi:MAG TPA: HAD-IA family hydrolase [Actinomycetota bacterium]|nr:HAD-IA family hydrolase [Actinomycetota bacterium]